MYLSWLSHFAANCSTYSCGGVEVLQTYSLLSCAGVWLGQHYYAVATVIIYKSH